MSLSVQIHGVPQAIAAMQHLTPAVRIRWMRQAMNAAGGVIKRQVVANAPVRTGLLKKSIRVKVGIPQASRNPKLHDKPGYALVGPGRGLQTIVSKRGKYSLITQKKTAAARLAGKKFSNISPSRYAHLAEAGRNGGVGATRFMARAVQQVAAQANQKFAAKIAQGIKTEAARLASKP